MIVIQEKLSDHFTLRYLVIVIQEKLSDHFTLRVPYDSYSRKAI